MKRLVALALAANSCAFGASTCRVVNGWDTKPSSKNARLTLLLSGKPQANARLTIITFDGRGSRSVVTGADGTAILQDLPEGITCVTVTVRDSLLAGLCLDVPARSGDAVSSFQMTLATTMPSTDSLENSVSRLEQSPPALRVRSLRGTIMDPVGGVIPKAELQIYKRGSYPRNPVQKLETDENGEFADLLEPGAYTVVVRRLGFAPKCFAVDIAQDAQECTFLQTMDVQAVVEIQEIQNLN
jgi:Carboxypeptidase regulatory-like domain